MSGIEHVARSVSAVLHDRLPWQRKTQRENLALLVATMLSERSDVAGGRFAAPVGADRHAIPVDPWRPRLISVIKTIFRETTHCLKMLNKAMHKMLFYGTPALIGHCQLLGWDYRLRL